MIQNYDETVRLAKEIQDRVGYVRTHELLRELTEKLILESREMNKPIAMADSKHYSLDNIPMECLGMAKGLVEQMGGKADEQKSN